MRPFFLLFFVTAAICAPAYSRADDERDQLEQINAQAAEQTAKLAELETRERDAAAELKRAQADLAAAKKEEAKAQADFNKLKAEVSRVDIEINRARDEAAALKRLSQSRVRALYMGGSSTLAEGLLNAGMEGEFAENAFYLAKITSYDKKLLDRINQARRIEEDRKGKLSDLVGQQRTVVQRLAGRRKLVEAKALERDVAQQKLKSERSAIELAVSTLKAQALRLETVMAGLTGGDAEVRAEPARGRQPAPPQKVGAYNGPGLKKLKGSLSLPTSARVLKGFGMHKAKDFADFVFSKGLEFAASADSPISAIADGKVAFNGRMPGYGTVLILDHGQRSYSLYGRLSDTKAELGEVVSKGAVIGAASQPDEHGRSFYFEIRQNGDSVNPKSFFGNRL